MRSHVWRKSFTRLSQRNLRLPVQRRHYHPTARQLNAITPPSDTGNSDVDSHVTKENVQDNIEDIKSRKLSSRRSRLFSKQPREVPTFAIPSWFLKHNVRLQESTPSTRSTSDKSKDAHRRIELVDGDTGHVLFTLPLPSAFSKEAQPPASSSSSPSPSSSSSNSLGDGTTDSHGLPGQTNRLANFFSPKDVAVGVEIDQAENPTAKENTTSTAIPSDPLVSTAVDNSSDSKSTTEPSNASTNLDSNPLLPDAKRAAKQLAPDTARPRNLEMYMQLQLLLNAAFMLTGPAAAKITKPNINLQSPDSFAHDDMDVCVDKLADLMHADLIRIDANDVAELAADYLDNGDYAPGSISALPFDVYRGARAVSSLDTPFSHLSPPADHAADNPTDAEDQDPDATEDAFAASPFAGVDIGQLGKFFQQNADKISKAFEGRQPVAINLARLNQLSNNSSSSAAESSRSPTFTIGSWDELKLQTLLDTLLDGGVAKRDATQEPVQDSFLRNAFQNSSSEPSPSSSESTQNVSDTDTYINPIDLFRHAVDTSVLRVHLLDRFLSRSGKPSKRHDKHHSLALKLEHNAPTTPSPVVPHLGTRTILHIRDLEAIQNTPQGEAIVRLFAKVVQRRRKDGQQIVILGTSPAAQSTFMDDLQAEEEEESTFRTLPFSKYASKEAGLPKVPSGEGTLATPAYQRLLDINLRNIDAMIRRLSLHSSDLLFHPSTRSHLNIPGIAFLADVALSQDQVQQIVLSAESLRTMYTNSPSLETIHIALAAALQRSLDQTLAPSDPIHMEPPVITAIPRGSSSTSPGDGKRPEARKLNMDQIKKSCDKHEKKLLSGVVDPQNLRTTFDHVHASPETIEALKTLTSLSLIRPEAFKYGVLANDRLPGLLLYGPPGTGKTMLAKAVAKEAQATVLEVSGAQVYEKYVGEGEKMVKAVFSLARKLSPCIVFIDEADALFGSRGGANSRTTHREIINQFLRDWDGMDDRSVFMMVATNRPFDLDDAVLRRLPRRLLVDLPVAKDRESILGIHLKDETLDSSVSLNKLSEETPLYSGSDLKNVCVAAALAAVREENALLTQHKDDAAFKLPERRTLTSKHFEKALAEISASISEDMNSLGSIRKFDEQYGDRRAKKKKSAYGFGTVGTEVDERAARVRQDERRQ